MQAKNLIERAKEVTGSDAETARQLEVPFQRISNWKTGVAACPPDVIARLAAIAGDDPTEALIEAVGGRLSEERRRGLMDAIQSKTRAMVKY
jgi:hypothetical protein